MERAERLLSNCADVDSVVISNGREPFLDSTFWYLTEQTSGSFEGTIAIVTGNGLDVIVNRLEETTALKGKGNIHVYETKDERNALVQSILKGSRTIGINAHAIPYASAEYLRKMTNAELTDVSKGIMETTAIKDVSEIDAIHKACRITSKVANEIPEMLREGMTEEEMAASMDNRMRGLGASGNAFDTIAAFGAHSAEPHHRPSGYALRKGDTALFDFGCRYGRYCSDLTRTVFFGEPREMLRKAYSVVSEAKAAGMAAIRDGARASDVDKAARDVIDASEFKGRFIHSFGHGVGMDVHEGISLSHLSDEVLKENMVVTAEPGIYIPGIGGIRIEDTLLVTKDGYKELTEFDRQWTVI